MKVLLFGLSLLVSISSYSFDFTVQTSEGQTIKSSAVLCYNVTGRSKMLNPAESFDLELIGENTFELPVEKLQNEACDEFTLSVQAVEGINHVAYTTVINQENLQELQESDEMFLRDTNHSIDNHQDGFIDRGLEVTSRAMSNVMAIVVCAVSSHSCIIP
ncbi:hypothetical protein A9Q84_15360 [Halobacteriovorax marinus]|uniref:Uncharacterized protein n=1 Tax=Halobacteriovorax marinus TaxID=97084 RepID=A0A1Y5F9C5_9BACT|nr:hypothetical protein A9Q84_15360 [Halobacteriovorax marinus]